MRIRGCFFMVKSNSGISNGNGRVNQQKNCRFLPKNVLFIF